METNDGGFAGCRCEFRNQRFGDSFSHTDVESIENHGRDKEGGGKADQVVGDAIEEKSGNQDPFTADFVGEPAGGVGYKHIDNIIEKIE